MNNTSSFNIKIHRVQSGFSLVEVLVTLVLIAIALLGTAGLQAYAMRTSKGGEFRTQAVFLASDIAERMESNKSGAVKGAYLVAASGVMPDGSNACVVGVCNDEELATYDIANWQKAIGELLVQPTWNIYTSSDNCQTGGAGVGNPITYCIFISWVDRRSNTTYNAAGTGETFSYTSRRTIHKPL